LSVVAVSVVVPAYRQAGFIAGCLDSIAGQKHESIEVVVVDDGCPEGSGDVAERHALRPKVVRQANAGVAAARNRGIAESSGDVVAFLDADDRWLPGKLAHQLVIHEQAPGPVLSFTRYRRVDEERRPVEAHDHPAVDQPCSAKDLLGRNFIGCSTVIVSRACLDDVGGFPDDAALRRGGQDYALWLRVGARYPLRYLPEVLTEYTLHAGNRVGGDAVKHFEGWAQAVRSFAAWDRPRFLELCDDGPMWLVTQRARNMVGDVARSPDQWKRAWQAFEAAVRTLIKP